MMEMHNTDPVEEKDILKWAERIVPKDIPATGDPETTYCNGGRTFTNNREYEAALRGIRFALEQKGYTIRRTPPTA